VCHQLVHQIEELAANAWPAPVVQLMGGWRLRFAWGITRRANSVLPNDFNGAPDLDERLALVEAFYARRGLPARYQISPAARPAGLDAVLADRGYRRHLRILVLSAELATVRDRLEVPGDRVVVAGEPDAAWLDTMRAMLGYYGDGAVAGRMLDSIGPPAGFASVRRAGRPLAIGRAVAERGFAGVFSMATVPEARRQGLGEAVLAALAGWAARHGATRLYLQVDDDNQAALRLYGHAGFEPAYAYHYRVAPDPTG
jgi:ribosomal protein S18 acetylase RimI-like enzyme